MGANAETVERAIAAFRARDLAAFAAELDPQVVVEGLKGTFEGIDEARRWATPAPGGELYMRVELDEIREVGDEYVAAGARRVWVWRESDEVAEETPFGLLVRLRNGRIVSWRQKFDSLVDALEAIPARHS